MPLIAKSFSNLITFTRASTATYFAANGVLTSAANNEPRFDYNPTTYLGRGILIEESRTNSIRNNTMVGAVAGTPGTLPTNWAFFSNITGITREIVGTGSEDGISYIDIRFYGTSTAGTAYDVQFEPATATAASNGQTWTESAYCKLIAGTLTGITTIGIRSAFRDGSSELTSFFQNFTPTSAALKTQRFTTTGTASNAATLYIIPTFAVRVAVGTAFDITLRIGLPQLELGAFATSVIPTTTTALTRAADVASVNTLNPWYNASAGSVYSEFVVNSTAPTSGFPTATSFNNGGIANRINSAYLNDAVNALDYFVSNGGFTQVGLSSITYTAGNVAKMAAAYATNDFALSTNGGAVLTDTSGTVPSVTVLNLGNQLSGNFLNGYLRRIVYYPRRLANADLQAITA